MRVLFLTPSFRGGGAERYARELCGYLREHGHEGEMLCARREKGDPDYVKGIRFRVEKHLKHFKHLGDNDDWRYLGSKFRLGRIQPGQFDVVHLHNLHSEWISLKATAELAQRIPAVWTLHDEWAITGGLPYDLSRHAEEQDLKRWLGEEYVKHVPHARLEHIRKFVHEQMPRPAVVVTPSQYLQKLALETGVFGKAKIVRQMYGLPYLKIKERQLDQAEARRRLGLDPNAPVAIFAAGNLLSPFKGAKVLQEALTHVRTNFTLLLLGKNGDQVEVPPGVVKRNLGHVDDMATVVTAYRAADVSLIPSLADVFPLVGLESLACECPVIGFAIGGLPDYIGAQNQCGMLVQPFDAKAYGQAIDTLLNHPELRLEKGRQGGLWAAEHCVHGKTMEAMLRIYDLARGSVGQPAGMAR